MRAIELLQLGVVAQVKLFHAGVAHIENQQLRVLAHVDALNVGEIGGEAQQLGAACGVEAVDSFIVVEIHRHQVGIVRNVEIRVHILNDAKLQNGEIGLVGTNHKRSSLSELVVADIDSLQVGVGREVKSFQLVVVKAENAQIGTLCKVNLRDSAAVAIEVVDYAWVVTIDFHYSFRRHLAGYCCALDSR